MSRILWWSQLVPFPPSFQFLTFEPIYRFLSRLETLLGGLAVMRIVEFRYVWLTLYVITLVAILYDAQSRTGS
jgi:hypothetical protein